MNGSVLLLLPMILPFIFGLIIGFQKEEKQRNILVSLQRRDANLRALADI